MIRYSDADLAEFKKYGLWWVPRSRRNRLQARLDHMYGEHVVRVRDSGNFVCVTCNKRIRRDSIFQYKRLPCKVCMDRADAKLSILRGNSVKELDRNRNISTDKIERLLYNRYIKQGLTIITRFDLRVVLPVIECKNRQRVPAFMAYQKFDEHKKGRLIDWFDIENGEIKRSMVTYLLAYYKKCHRVYGPPLAMHVIGTKTRRMVKFSPRGREMVHDVHVDKDRHFIMNDETMHYMAKSNDGRNTITLLDMKRFIVKLEEAGFKLV